MKEDEMKYKIPSDEELFLFWEYIIDRDAEGIKTYLEKGYSPDVCRGPTGWHDRNPLWIITNDETDVIYLMEILLDSGADVTMRPYIYQIIDHHVLTPEDMLWINSAEEGTYRKKSGTTSELIYKKVKILIEAGADIDYKGAPNRLLFPDDNISYERYFKKEGKRPINLAIQKKLYNVVDLLLDYTTIDEDSLKAAKESDDLIMIEKINSLWVESQRNR
jgi:hypothetical protein